MEEFEPHYMIIVDRVNNLDTFQVQVELRLPYYSDGMSKIMALREKIAKRLQNVIGIHPDIKIVEPRSLERSQGKAKHVTDNRKF
jgi:phenylacetate-CoA ligase